MKTFFTITLLIVSIITNAQDEATQSQVTSKGDLIYKNSVPFTGTLYSDNSANNTCKCTLEANYKNGKLNGVKKEFYSNGKPKLVAQYSNGKIIGKITYFDRYGNKITKYKSISNEEVLYFALKIYKPIKFSRTFSKSYLKIFDDNYDNYRNNEFELNRKINNVKEIINIKINNLKFDNVYEEIGRTYLPNYSFKTNSYNLNGYNSYFFSDKSYVEYKSKPGISYLSYDLEVSDDLKVTHRLLKIKLINIYDFFEIRLSPEKAESLLNKLGNNRIIYYNYEYKILPLKFLQKYSTTSIEGIYAYITKIDFYSSNKRNELVYTMNASLSYDEYIAKYKRNSVIKKNEIKKQTDNQKNQESKAKINSNNRASNRSERLPRTRNIYRRTPRSKSPNRTKKYNNSNKYSQTDNKSLNTIIKSAEEGNLNAQYRLAVMYVTGKGLNKDLNKAFYWFEKSAKSGFVKSQEELAAIYYQKNDFNNAFIWYSKAANANNSRAQYVLGYMYRKGIGVKKSRRSAKKWWKESCKLGNQNACNEIKKMNEFGNALLRATGEAIKRNYIRK